MAYRRQTGRRLRSRPRPRDRARSCRASRPRAGSRNSSKPAVGIATPRETCAHPNSVSCSGGGAMAARRFALSSIRGRWSAVTMKGRARRSDPASRATSSSRSVLCCRVSSMRSTVLAPMPGMRSSSSRAALFTSTGKRSRCRSAHASFGIDVEIEHAVVEIGDDLLRRKSVEPVQPVGLIEPVLPRQRRGLQRQRGARVRDRAERRVVDALEIVARVERCAVFEDGGVARAVGADDDLRALTGRREPRRVAFSACASSIRSRSRRHRWRIVDGALLRRECLQAIARSAVRR